MHIRYLMLDNGIEFEDEVVPGDKWRDLKPKMVCMQGSCLMTKRLATPSVLSS